MVQRHTVVMGANYQYIRQVKATVKSLLYYNGNIDIYLLNSDIPQECFRLINKIINPLGSQIIDRKINSDLLNGEYEAQDHLNVIAYARCFIPELIPDDIAVYLDSDVIVHGSIDSLFNCHFSENELLAAAPEVADNNQFNDGVLVFNNKKLREVPDLATKLLDMGKDIHLYNGDQSVFNIYFKGHFKRITSQYNYEIGMDRWAYMQHLTDMQKSLNEMKNPIIIHYANDDKPWNLMSSGRMRKLWWHFYGMNWDAVVQHEQTILGHLTPINHDEYVGSLFTLTNDQNLTHIETLINALPNWHFTLAAYTIVGYGLWKLIQYPNVTIIKSVLSFAVDDLIEKSDAYLDINYIGKFPETVQQFLQTGKPVLAFDSTKVDILVDNSNYYVFDSKEPKTMINKIRSLKK